MDQNNQGNKGDHLLSPSEISPKLFSIDSRELFKDGYTSIQIIHKNEIYTLRITKGDKLILTK